MCTSIPLTTSWFGASGPDADSAISTTSCCSAMIASASGAPPGDRGAAPRFRLAPHPRKTRVFRVQGGITFLGWRLIGDRTRLVRPAAVRVRDGLVLAWSAPTAPASSTRPAVRQRLHAWLGHAALGRHVAAPALDSSDLLSLSAVPGHRPGWFAAGPGTTTRRTCGCRTATTTRPPTATTIIGFRCAREVERVAPCGHPPPEPRRSRSPRACGLHVRAPLQVTALP